MEWREYKALCDSPHVFSRWMLEQTTELLGIEPSLAAAVSRALEGDALEKPEGHVGGTPADMFRVDLSIHEARAVVRVIDAAVSGGRTTHATRVRGLGGFREAWLEYATYVERREFGNRVEGESMSNSNVVKGLIAAFNASDLDKIMSHFAAGAVYHNIPVDPVSGTDAIRGVIQGFMGMATKVDWELRQIAESAQGVVLTERVDRFLVNGKWISLPVMGAFEVSGSKITAWRDYFDMNQFQSQLAG